MGIGIKPTIEIVAVSTSATLKTMVTAADLAGSTKRVTLRPHAAGIYMDDGTATASSDPLGTAAVEIAGGPKELADLEFFAAVATNMTVIQEG